MWKSRPAYPWRGLPHGFTVHWNTGFQDPCPCPATTWTWADFIYSQRKGQVWQTENGCDWLQLVSVLLEHDL